MTNRSLNPRPTALSLGLDVVYVIGTRHAYIQGTIENASVLPNLKYGMKNIEDAHALRRRQMARAQSEGIWEEPGGP